jgi:hypothetical protein
MRVTSRYYRKSSDGGLPRKILKCTQSQYINLEFCTYPIYIRYRTWFRMVARAHETETLAWGSGSGVAWAPSSVHTRRDYI